MITANEKLKKVFWFSIFFLFMSGTFLFGDKNIVNQYGNLYVSGKKLMGNSGQVQLKGLSSHGPQWFSFKDNSTTSNLVAQFGIDVLRIAMYIEHEQKGYLYTPEGPLRGKTYMKEQTNMMVQDAINQGIYVIIDWHIHNDPNNFTDEAIAFFEEMVTKWGNKSNVIFEICNEPQYVSWAAIKNYADKVIPAIRAKEDQVWGVNDPDNIIIVGTPEWNQRPDLVIGNALTYNNILYSVHFYAATHYGTEFGNAKKAYDAGLPLIASEWGVSSCYGGGWNDYDNADTWLDWLDSRGISWIAWSISNKDESSAIFEYFESHNENNEARWRANEEGRQSGPWDESEITDAGQWLMDKIGGGTLPEPPTDGGGGGSDETKYEAEYAALSGNARTSTVHTGYSGSGFVEGYYNSCNANTKFTISASEAGNQTLKIRYTAAGGASNTGLYVNGTKVKNLQFKATGNWSSWADHTETISLNSGNNTIEFKAEIASKCANFDYITVSGSTSTSTPTPGDNLITRIERRGAPDEASWMKSSASIILTPNTSTGDYTRWERIEAGGGYYYFKNIGSNRYLHRNGDDLNVVATPGEDCKWLLIDANVAGYWRIQSKTDGRWIKANHEDGNLLMAGTDSTGDRTRWFFLQS